MDILEGPHRRQRTRQTWQTRAGPSVPHDRLGRPAVSNVQQSDEAYEDPGPRVKNKQAASLLLPFRPNAGLAY